jgi:hypothetical protein
MMEKDSTSDNTGTNKIFEALAPTGFSSVKRQRLFVLMGLFYFVCFILLTILKRDISYILKIQEKIITLFSVLTLLVSFVIIANYYLNYGFNSAKSETTGGKDVMTEINVLRDELNEFKRLASNESDEENTAFFDTSKEEADDSDDLFSKYLDARINDGQNKYLTLDIHERVSYEIRRLSYSANLNLAVGSVITIAAVSALGYEVYFNSETYTGIIPLLSHYVPRISLVVLIEVFAFFFLRIYKANLAEIKYFHNEKTNIDLIFRAIEISADSNMEVKKLTIESLLKTERNFILKKDETTVDLQKNIIESNNSNKIIETLTSLLKTK